MTLVVACHPQVPFATTMACLQHLTAALPPPPCNHDNEEGLLFFICLEDKKKEKKSGFTKLLNLLSPRLKRRANYGCNGGGEDDDDDDDDDNDKEGVPRKTLVTATIRREIDAAPAADVPGGGALNGPTTKLMDVYSSLTFKQEILGKAATDKDDGVRAKPGDNNHQDDNNNNDNKDDGDGGGFTGSAGGYQSGA
jgi:hypothetical protein